MKFPFYNLGISKLFPNFKFVKKIFCKVFYSHYLFLYLSSSLLVKLIDWSIHRNFLLIMISPYTVLISTVCILHAILWSFCCFSILLHAQIVLIWLSFSGINMMVISEQIKKLQNGSKKTIYTGFEYENALHDFLQCPLHSSLRNKWLNGTCRKQLEHINKIMLGDLSLLNISGKLMIIYLSVNLAMNILFHYSFVLLQIIDCV